MWGQTSKLRGNIYHKETDLETEEILGWVEKYFKKK